MLFSFSHQGLAFQESAMDCRVTSVKGKGGNECRGTSDEGTNDFHSTLCARHFPHDTRPSSLASSFVFSRSPQRPAPFNPPPRLQGREGRASRRRVVPPGQVWVLSCILRSTSSRLKLAAFWRCGYSLNVCRNCPTKACAGTIRKT